MGLTKAHLIMAAIALGVIWASNNVEFVGNLVAKKA